MILDKILGGLSVQRGPWPLSQTPGQLFSGRQASSGAPVSEDDALSLSAVFSGVQLLSRVLATLPLVVYRRVRQWGRDAREQAKSNPSHWILGTEFNPEMSAVIGRRVMEFYRLLFGAGIGQIAWDGAGRAAAIWPLQTWRVKPMRDDDGTLWYQVDRERRVEAADIICVPGFTKDGVTWESFLDYAFESLGMSISAQEFAGRFFANDATPGVILKHPGNPKKQAREELRDSWNEAHAGSKNRRKTAVVWGGWDVADGGGLSPEDAQLLGVKAFGVVEVSRWLNIPPHLLRDLSRATFSNIEQQGIDFIVYSIGPTLKEWEQEFDRKLLSPPDVYCKHNVNALMRGDTAMRGAWYNTLLNNGVFSVNDVREYEDLNPIESGNTYFVPLNMVPIGRAVAPPVAPAPAAPPPPAAPADPPAPASAPYPLAAELPSPLAIPACRELLAHTLDRLARVEAHALERAAQKPGRLFAWMDEFYAAHPSRLQAALEPVANVIQTAVGVAAGYRCKAGELAHRWCEESRQAILSAADAPPAEFAGRVEALLAEWDDRPLRTAQELLTWPHE